MNLRSLVAVVAGIVLYLLLSQIVGSIAFALLPEQPKEIALYLAAVIVAFIASFLAANGTARLAPERPLLHAAILGTLVTVVGFALRAGAGDRVVPLDYTFMTMGSALVGALLGGLFVARSPRLDPADRQHQSPFQDPNEP